MVSINNYITHLILVMGLCLTSTYAETSPAGQTPDGIAPLTIKGDPGSSPNNVGDGNLYFQEKKRGVVMEAAAAVQACELAAKFLNVGDLPKARASIDWAKQQLNGLKVAIPDAPMIPIDAQGRLIHLSTDVKRLKVLQAKVKALVANNNYQAARPLIDMMADEMRVRMVLLPINRFSGEVESISELMGSGFISRAKAHLHDAINGLVIKEEMVPIPILRAEELIAEATEHNLARGTTTASKTETHEMVTAALEQLKIAELLGYGESQDYASMNATAQQMNNEKNTGRFLSESRHFLEQTSDFKHRLSYMSTPLDSHDAFPGQENTRQAAKLESF